jgi:hypothetical protein
MNDALCMRMVVHTPCSSSCCCSRGILLRWMTSLISWGSLARARMGGSTRQQRKEGAFHWLHLLFVSVGCSRCCACSQLARAPTHGDSAASLRGCAHGWHLSTLPCSILVVINALAMLLLGHTRTCAHCRSARARLGDCMQGPVGVLRTQVHDCHVPRAPARRSFHLNLSRDCTAARA